MRLVLSIPGLERGGAERQFAALAAGLAARGHDVLAVTLGPGGPLAADLGGARLATLNKTARRDNPRVALALLRLLRRAAPAVHYAFLPSCCVLGGLLDPLLPGVRLAMGVRASSLPDLPPAARLLLWLEARLSRRAALVVANARAGLRDAAARGFVLRHAVVVPNGVDTARFRPDRSIGAALRRRWGADASTTLVGLPARLDPMKDHATFLSAAALLRRRWPDTRFVCVGGGPDGYTRELRARAEALGLAGHVVWAGEVADMPAVYNALDVCCLSSAYGEGFPNVLAEALACGVPCAATDVGDAAAVVAGGVGASARPGDPSSLAGALDGLLRRMADDGPALSVACRELAETRFSLENMVGRTEALLADL